GLDLQIDQEKCIKCGLCTRACPAGALKIQELNDVL
ncbi:MAG: 4Fe-4S binding protein, partial [Fibrobacter sp.]|nr:4Fe-4S binding protein [Fibrobacter sp.]